MTLDLHSKIKKVFFSIPSSFAFLALDNIIEGACIQFLNQCIIGCSLQDFLNSIKKHSIEFLHILLLPTLVVIPTKCLGQVRC